MPAPGSDDGSWCMNRWEGGPESTRPAGMQVTVAVRLGGVGRLLERQRATVMGTILRGVNMPDGRLMCGREVQSQDARL